ncbi:MAG TPA: FAD-binding oxidoreductase [Chloroflexaceae bacterium]|nr:FAD-binding oxidoreductase [Chloroflexaceae bacterium]
MRATADVVVIGGGCAGASVAWHLARRGAGRVLLLERGAIAGGATGWSSAIVRTHYTHEALARMALAARRVFEHFGDVVGGDAGFQRTGFLVLLGPADVEAAAANVAAHQRLGIASELLRPGQFGRLEPRLSLAGVAAAVWEPDSGYADPHGATMGYAAAARRHGAELRLGAAALVIGRDAAGVAYVETDQGRVATRAVVVAAGYRTRALVSPLGVEVPLTPIRHAIAIVRRTAGFGPRHPVVSDRVLGSYYRPEGAELTMIGTTAAHEGREDHAVEAAPAPTMEEEAALFERFCARFPGQELAAAQRGYTGVYDCTPDLQPILGPTAVPGLHLAVGFSGHGFKLSPAVGELVARGVLDGPAATSELDLFRLGRFAEGRPIRAAHAYSVGTLG